MLEAETELTMLAHQTGRLHVPRVFEGGAAHILGPPAASCRALVMEFIDGVPLSAVKPLNRAHRAEQPIIKDVCLGLHRLHGAGIVHRDVKDGNVMLDVTGRAVLVDFGLSILTSCLNDPTAKAFVTGTPGYMAPETADRTALWTDKLDVWSLGCLAISLIDGENPLEKMLRRVPGQRVDGPELLTTVREMASPRLEASGYLDLADDFVARCCKRSVTRRCTTAALARHPFVTTCGSEQHTFLQRLVRNSPRYRSPTDF